MDFLLTHKNKIAEIKHLYPIPISEDFKDRKFSKLKWNAKTRNFYTILKVLSEYGPCTISEIVSHDDLNQSESKQFIRKNVYNRMITGNKSLGMSGLIDKKIIEVVNNENSKIKKYGLSLHGLFLSMRCFSEDNYIIRGNPLGKLDFDFELEIIDYSGQKYYPEFFVDTLAKNYSHLLPMIFGKWDYLKSHPRINAYFIGDVISDSDSGLYSLIPDLVDDNKFQQLVTNSSYYITLLFFCIHLNDLSYSFKIFFDSLDFPSRNLISVFFSSFVHKTTSDYYRAKLYESVFLDDNSAIAYYFELYINNKDLLSEKYKTKIIETYDIKKLKSKLFRF